MDSKRINDKIVLPYFLPLRCILFLVAFLLLFSISKLTFLELSKWWTTIAIIVNIATILFLCFFSFRKGITYRELLHYEKGKTTVKSTVLIVIVTLVVGMIGLYLAGLICYGTFPYLDKTLVQPIPLWLAIIILLVLPMTTTLAEDGLYLGYGLNICSGKKWLIISLTAFFYALQHCFIPFLPDIRFILYRFFSFLPLTFLFSFWYQRNKNPVPFMMSHFILNIATSVQILIMTIFPELYQSL